MRDFGTIGVVGAGTIGSGVAQLFAQSGLQVVLVDSVAEQLETACKNITKNARLYGMVHKSLPAPAGVLNRLTFTTDMEALSGTGFVIENITENVALKTAVHHEIDHILPPETPVAANTSAIPITRIASFSRHPNRVIGMHFMNPPPIMPMVEIIRATHSTPQALQAAADLVAAANKQSILVNDSPGFVTNRVMMLMVNEAMFLVHEGVADVQGVDRLFKTCFGHKMGPLETADLIGLDTVKLSLDILYDEFNDPKYRPCPLLKRLVYAGQTGRKAGRGFHTYDQ
ncbi:3-hydroxyacyl-CoA dehydrogenase family protein [Phaeobacter sp. 11ANDIMAR09]|uniref:3-hydroxyacyl-CoA dehydrogenase family protein n=1 Tax=Phaeobacter sp. 11ANDIMAR09 TaxID=1225647 RepID=UPI0006C8D59A|nr:3-hydroxyacyl-CoA dehydrogenase NAD-binding domain-containing protein [Phaeobacter sp. 11ANDIMAR09]KPD11755.1 3-hydroxybutyryl-CoA dehydrogenase [Phaeobacter sp. 11ANDIMAR09]